MKLTITCEKVYMKKRIILSLTKKTMVIHNPICKKKHHLKTLLNLLYVWASQLPFGFVMMNFKLQVYNMFFYIICRLFLLLSFWKRKCCECYALFTCLLCKITHWTYQVFYELWNKTDLYIFESDTCFLFEKYLIFSSTVC